MSDTPTSVAVREMEIAGVTLRMHYLDNGKNVIEAVGMDAFVRKAEAGEISPADARRAMKWVRGDA